jgi:hypothetical protein
MVWCSSQVFRHSKQTGAITRVASRAAEQSLIMVKLNCIGPAWTQPTPSQIDGSGNVKHSVITSVILSTFIKCATSQSNRPTLLSKYLNSFLHMEIKLPTIIMLTKVLLHTLQGSTDNLLLFRCPSSKWDYRD